MRIRSVCASHPDRVVTNDEVLEEIRAASRQHLSDRDLSKLTQRIERQLRLSGTERRRWRADGQRAADFVKQAARGALEQASLDAAQIDLLIYVGVGRACLEPATANIFQHELGMTGATCFDLLDACLSWLRALHVGYQYITAGVYRNVMILNGEFNCLGSLGWRVFKSLDEIDYRFAGYCTIGEAATATILSGDEQCNGEPDPHFEFRTDASLHKLCKIPLPLIGEFSAGEKCPELAPHSFFAYSAELFRASMKMIPEVYFKSDELQRRRIDIVFPHTASRTIVDKLAGVLGLGEQTVNLYAEYGNTVSASVPVAMDWALEHGRLARGDQMLIAIGSAGFSVGLAHLVF